MCKKFIFLISLCLVVCLSGNATGAIVWDDGGDNHYWKTAENWDTDTVPTDTNNVEIVMTDPNYCLIDGTHIDDACAVANQLSVGKYADGELRMTGGILDVNSYFRVGDQQTGTFDMDGGAVTANAFAVGYGMGSPGSTFTMTAGVIDVNGGFNVGNQSGAGGSLTITGGASITNAGNFNIGNNNATGDVNMVDGSITSESAFSIGNNSGSGTLDMHAGTIDVNDNMNVAGRQATGTLNMNGGTITVMGGSDLRVGYYYGTGILNMNGGTIDVSDDMHIGEENSGFPSTGTVTVTGSEIKVADVLNVGHKGGSTGTLTVKAGTVDVGGTMYLGNTSSTGTFNLEGGTVTAAGALNAGHKGGGIGDVNMVDGTLAVTGTNFRVGYWGGSGNIDLKGGNLIANNLNLGQTNKDFGGTGTVTMTGGGIKAYNNLRVGFKAASTGTLTVQSGTVNVINNLRVGDQGATGTLPLTGGTIIAGNHLEIGRQGGTGTIDMQNGTLNVGNQLRIGRTNNGIPGTGTLTVTSGVINVYGGNLDVGRGGSTGTLNLNGGVINASGTLRIGTGTGGSPGDGDLNLGSTIYADNLTMDSNGTLDIDGGKLVLNGTRMSKIRRYANNGLITIVGGPSEPRCVGAEYDPLWGTTTVEYDPAPDLLVAYWPRPRDGVGGQAPNDVDYTIELTWSPGDNVNDVNGHAVYFGTDYVSVRDATTSDPEYIGSQDANTISPVVGLGTDYFWRIDEVNQFSGTTEGPVWSFSTRTWLSVDNFEDYPNDVNLGETWNDGADNYSTSTLALETVISNNGSQSIKVTYDNLYWPHYAEVDRDVSDPNWKRADVKAMALWFRGDSGNDANGPMYVALEDGSGRRAQIEYDGDPNDLRSISWTRWDIELQEFVDDNSVDLTDVSKLAIGFGEKYVDPWPSYPASGTVYFDDIRLYVPRCAKKEGLTLYGEWAGIGGGCEVNYDDVETLALNWLDSNSVVAASGSPPDAGRLQVYYKFDDEIYDGNVIDSAGDSNGTVYGSYWWDTYDGHDGGCLEFDGASVYVEVPKEVLSNINEEITISVWTNGHADLPIDGNDILFMCRSEYDRNIIDIRVPQGNGNVRFYCGRDPLYANDSSTLDQLNWTKGEGSEPPAWRGKWNHYAFVKNVNEGTLKIYHNGVMVDRAYDRDALISGDLAGNDNVIGASSSDDRDEFYKGRLDDFRIYDYALSHEEIVNLAEESSVEQPLLEELSDPSGDEKVNFKDYAILANRWLADPEPLFWP